MSRYQGNRINDIGDFALNIGLWIFVAIWIAVGVDVFLALVRLGLWIMEKG